MPKGNYYAHRFSYALHHGPIPAGLIVRHKCDTPACVNPDHLLVGTQKQNMEDMRARGRQGNYACQGEQNGRAKLNERKVREIRQRYKGGETNKAALGREYGITGRMIAYVVNGNNWK